MAKDFEIEVKVDNTKEILLAEDKVIKTILDLIGIQVQGEAVTEITKVVYSQPPSGDYKRTGRLRASITYATSNKTSKVRKEASQSDAVPEKPKSDEKAVYIGTNVEYAPHVEFGTYKQNAKPYLRPAVEQSQDAINGIIKKAFEK